MSQATLRYVRVSPTKVRQVLGLIRGLEVDDARETLVFCERAAAQDVLKLLDSAVANAEHNEQLPVDELYVQQAWADQGPILNRFRPRARGRATRIRKRTSHVTIIVSRYSDDELESRRRAEEAKGAVAPRSRRTSRRRRVRRHEEEHKHDESAAEDVDEAAAEVDDTEVDDTEVDDTEVDDTEVDDTETAPDTAASDEDDEKS